MKYSWVLLLVVSVAFGQTGNDAAGPAQPLPFSHNTHVDAVKLACADCHVYPEKFGDPVGIPDASKCLECHAFSSAKTETLRMLNSFCG
jgi:hypothetical protein